MNARPLAAALLLLAGLAGCVDAPSTTVTWEVRNESTQAIAYTLILEGPDGSHWTNGTVGPQQVRHHEASVAGTDLQAEARLRDEPRASAGVPFAVDGLCGAYTVIATWDGETWAVDAAARCD